MNNNERYNRAAIKQFRKELSYMFDDIRDIDVRCLNKAVNVGLKDVKNNTNVVSGYMRKSWSTTPTLKTNKGITKEMINIMDYSSYVNYGHRLVSKKGDTVGFVKGQYMLEKAVSQVDKALVKEFEKEVERVNRKHDK